jgi:hypothetical protein
MTWKQIRSFKAYAPDGTEYLIDESAEFHEFSNSKTDRETQETIGRRRRYETDDGQLVKHISENRYVLVDTGVELTLGDPTAP